MLEGFYSSPKGGIEKDNLTAIVLQTLAEVFAIGSEEVLF